MASRVPQNATDVTVNLLKECLGIIVVEQKRWFYITQVEPQSRFHDTEARFAEKVVVGRFITPKRKVVEVRLGWIKHEVRGGKYDTNKRDRLGCIARHGDPPQQPLRRHHILRRVQQRWR